MLRHAFRGGRRTLQVRSDDLKASPALQTVLRTLNVERLKHPANPFIDVEVNDRFEMKVPETYQTAECRIE